MQAGDAPVAGLPSRHLSATLSQALPGGNMNQVFAAAAPG
jgi:hypothetical protein